MVETITTVLTQAWQYVASIDPHTWALLGSLVGVSTFHEGIKQWLKAKAKTIGPKTNALLSFSLVGIPASIDYATNFAAQNPGILPGKWLLLFGALQPIYRFGVKPAFAFVLAVIRDVRLGREVRQQQDAAPAMPAELDV